MLTPIAVEPIFAEMTGKSGTIEALPGSWDLALRMAPKEQVEEVEEATVLAAGWLTYTVVCVGD